MSASDNLSSQQFMRAHEIAKLPMLDARKNETNEQVLARKLQAAKEDKWEPSKGMYESIKKIGVQQPVEIIHSDKGQMLGEGHHRIAVAMEVNPDMLVPVKHIDANDKDSYW